MDKKRSPPPASVDKDEAPFDMSKTTPAMVEAFVAFMQTQKHGSSAGGGDGDEVKEAPSKKKAPQSANLVTEEQSSVIVAPKKKPAKKASSTPATPRKTKEEKAEEKKRAAEAEQQRQLELARQLVKTEPNPYLHAVAQYSLRSYDDPVAYFAKLMTIARKQIKASQDELILLGAILRLSFDTTHTEHVLGDLGQSMEGIIAHRFDKAESRQKGTVDIARFVVEYIQPLYFLPPEWLIATKGGVIPERFLGTSKRRGSKAAAVVDKASANAESAEKPLVTRSLNQKEMVSYLLELAKDGDGGDIRAAWYKTTMLPVEPAKQFWALIDRLRKEIFDNGIRYVEQHSEEYLHTDRRLQEQCSLTNKIKATYEKLRGKYYKIKAAGEETSAKGVKLMDALREKQEKYVARKQRAQKYKKQLADLKERLYPSMVIEYPFYATEWYSQPLDKDDRKQGKKAEDGEEDEEEDADEDASTQAFRLFTNRAVERFISNCSTALEWHASGSDGKHASKRGGGGAASPPFVLAKESLAIAKLYEHVWKGGQRDFERALRFNPIVTERANVNELFVHIATLKFTFPAWPFRWLVKNEQAAEAMLKKEASLEGEGQQAVRETPLPPGTPRPRPYDDEEEDEEKDEGEDEDKMDLDAPKPEAPEEEEEEEEEEEDGNNVDAMDIDTPLPPKKGEKKKTETRAEPAEDKRGKKRSKHEAELSSHSDQKSKPKKAKTGKEAEEKKKKQEKKKEAAKKEEKKKAVAEKSKPPVANDAMDLDEAPKNVVDLVLSSEPDEEEKDEDKQAKKAPSKAAAPHRPMTLAETLRQRGVANPSQLFSATDADAQRTIQEERARLISLTRAHQFSQPYPTTTLIPTADAQFDLLRSLDDASTAKKMATRPGGALATLNVATLLRAGIVAQHMERVATNHATAVRDRAATIEEKHEAALMDYMNDEANVDEMAAKTLPILGANKITQLAFTSPTALAMSIAARPIKGTA